LQNVKNKVVYYYVERSQCDGSHISVDDEKRQGDKDMKVHLQATHTLLDQDDGVGQQDNPYKVSEKLASSVVFIANPADKKEQTPADSAQIVVVKKYDAAHSDKKPVKGDQFDHKVVGLNIGLLAKLRKLVFVKKQF